MSEPRPSDLPVTVAEELVIPPPRTDAPQHTPPTAEQAGAAPPLTAPSESVRYQPVRFHAKGGLGEVVVALDAELHREVALKRIQPARAGDVDSRRRFLLEAEITGRLEHPGIVPVYGLVQDAHGQPSYAMRFIEGESLKDAIERLHGAPLTPSATPRGEEKVGETGKGGEAGKSGEAGKGGEAGKSGEAGLTLRQLLNRLVAVCNTLAFAHSRGVIHRDLKPANIMLGKFGETLVVDWGLAKPFERTATERAAGEQTLAPSTGSDSSATEQGQTVGTPAYMSPEQAAGHWDVLGPPGDICSLGATLYAVLTGRAPFQGRTREETLRKARAGDCVPPRQLVPHVPRALEAICFKAMAFKPEDRYATALDLAADLERWLADEPVAAYPEPWLLKTRRWIGRHRTLVTAAAAAVFVAVASLATATVLLTAANQREHEERTKAEDNFRMARDAVDKMLTEVGSRELLDVPQTEPVRKRLLEKALAFYQQYLEQKGSEPSFRRETGRAYLRVAQIYDLLGESARAEEAGREALALFEQLHTDFPADANYQEELANSHNFLGLLFEHLRRLPEADTAHRQALALREKLAASFPESASYRQQVAHSLNNLGLVLEHLDRRPEAEQAYRRAVDLQQKLVTDYPDMPGYRQDLAKHANNLGALQQATNRLQEAEDNYRWAIDLHEKLAKDAPSRSDYRHDLAKHYRNLGNLLADRAAQGKAEEAYGRAVALQEKLAADFPSTPSYRHELGHNLHAMARLLSRDRPLDAERDCRRAVALYDKLAADFPTRSDYLSDLARSYHVLGTLLANTDRDKETEQVYRQTLVALEKLAKDSPAVAERRLSLAQQCNRLAKLLHDTDQSAQAATLYRRTLALYQELVTEKPRVPAYEQQLALSQGEFASLLERARPKEAEQLRRQALVIQEKLVADFPDKADYQSDLGGSLNNLAMLLRDRGELIEARQRLDQAITHQRAALKVDPKNAGYRQFLANHFLNLGKTLVLQRKPQEAEDAYRQSLAICRQLHSDFPKHPSYWDNVASLYRELGGILENAKQYAEAEKVYLQAVEFEQELVRSDPKNARYQSSLGASYNSLGSLYRTLRQPTQAHEAYRQAIAIREQLVRDYPKRAEYGVNLGASYCNQGNLETGSAGPTDKALDWYARAIGTLEGVLREKPAAHVESMARQYLRNSHLNRAGQLGQANRQKEALADWDRALELDAGEEIGYIRLSRANALAHVGEHARAVAEAQDILEQKPLPPGTLHRMARVYALSSVAVGKDAKVSPIERDQLAEQYAARAVGLLRAARPSYFKAPANIDFLKKDSELDALRSRPDFQVLLAGLTEYTAGLHWTAGRLPQAEAAFKETIALWESLIHTQPKADEHRYALARAQSNLGNFYAGTKRNALAETALQKAVAGFEQLVRDHPKVDKYQNDLAGAENNLGYFYYRTKRPSEAEPRYQRALSLAEPLVRDHPDVPEYAVGLGGICCNMANHLRDQGKAEAALDWYARSIQTLRGGFKLKPLSATATEFLHTAHLGRGLALTRLERHKEALADWDNALALDKKRFHDQIRLFRAASLAHLGEHARATTEADAVTQAKDVTARMHYDAACVYALSAAAVKSDAKQTEQYAARAVALLRQAVVMGYENVELMKKDRDLDALRQREDFKALLRELEEKRQQEGVLPPACLTSMVMVFVVSPGAKVSVPELAS